MPLTQKLAQANAAIQQGDSPSPTAASPLERPLGAYMRFVNEKKDMIRAENSDFTWGQVGQVLGERWKAMDTSQRETYERAAKEDRERYEAEKERYEAEQIRLEAKPEPSERENQ